MASQVAEFDLSSAPPQLCDLQQLPEPPPASSL